VTFSEILALIDGNQLLSTLVATVLVGFATWLRKGIVNSRDKKRIFSYLSSSSATTDWTFRSTSAIASATDLTEKRVEEICAQHPKIKRNETQKQSWKVIE
jgi:hypothetical protein